MKATHVIALGVGGLFAAGVAWYLWTSNYTLFSCDAVGDAGESDSGLANEICIMTTGSKRLSISEIAQLALNAGFEGDDAAIATSIAIAESNGNPGAYNPESEYFRKHPRASAQGNGSYGLWQIFLHAHPEYTAESLTDPQTNANAAYAVYDAAHGKFTPWSTYTNQAYLTHLDAATEAVNA